MNLNKLYEKYYDISEFHINAATKNEILNELSKVESINSIEEARQFVAVLAKCRGAQVAMEGEKRNNTFRTFLSTGESGVYVEDDSYINVRFMYELIQNVDDCKYKTISDCNLNIIFDVENDVMTLKYNEIGFRPKDVIAISDIGNSTKNHSKSVDQTEAGIDKDDLQEIGEKGIGFKSIFGLADKVSIRSGYFDFFFDYEEFTIPKIENNKAFEKVDGTILTLYLKKGIAAQLYNMLESKYKNTDAILNENPILFLNKLTEISYSNGQDYFGFKVSRSIDATDIDGELMRIEYNSSKKEDCKSYDCYRYVKEIEYTIEECKSRFGDNESEPRKYKIEILTLANFNSKSFMGRIYSYLPTSQKISVPLIIHAPFKLTSGRTNISNQSLTAESANAWFIRTKNETINFIHHVLEDLAKKLHYSICTFVPEINLINSDECPLYDSKLSTDSILNLKLFEAYDGNFYRASELCFLKKNGLSSEQNQEIHKLLKIKHPLLKYEFKKEPRNYYGFIEINDIDKKLFKVALEEADKTEACVNYLKDFKPSDELKNSYRYKLTEEQIIILCENKEIISFINSETMKFIRQEGCVRFELDSYPKTTSRDYFRLFDYCDNKSDGLDEKLHNYLDNSSFVEDDYYEQYVSLTNCVFGNNAIEAYGKIFETFNKKYKNFFAFIKIDEFEKSVTDLCDDDRCNVKEFLDKLNDLRALQKGALGNQYKKIIKLINESGTKPQRFLMELLQNIDDCIYDEKPFAVINAKSNIIEISYNERGFTKKNIASITAIGDSTKQYLDENATGEKGIGFKSIFNVAEKVEIHSGDSHFYLTADKPTIPQKISSETNTTGTVMKINIKNGFIDFGDEESLCSACLCLKKLKNIVFNGKKMEIIDSNGLRTLKFNETYEYYRFDYQYLVRDGEVLASRYDDKNAKVNQKITYLIPVENKLPNTIYSTFPTDEYLNVPLVIDANLRLNTSRDLVLKNNLWNEYTFKEIENGYVWMLNELKNVDYEKMAEVIPYDCKIFKKGNLSDRLKDALQNKPIFKVYNSDEFISARNAYIANDLDKCIIDIWGCYNGTKKLSPFRNDLIELDEEKITDYSIFNRREFYKKCEELNDEDIYNVNFAKYIKNEKFRKILYSFFNSYNKYKDRSRYIFAVGIDKWEIIPVYKESNEAFVPYSENIFYSKDQKKSISSNIMVLNQGIMDEDLFNRIYHYMLELESIRVYSRGTILDDMVKKINAICKGYYRDEEKARSLLELFETDPLVFKKCINERKSSLNIDDFYFYTRNNHVLKYNACYLPYKDENNDILNNVIVAKKYIELAKAVSLDKVDKINTVRNVYGKFNKTNLNQLFSLESLKDNTDFFDSLYKKMFDFEYNELIENEVYINLIGSVSKEALECKEGNFKSITTGINRNCIHQHGNKLTNIFFKLPHHLLSFSERINLEEFDSYDLINDIRNELQVRKNDDKIRLANELIDNCYYCLDMDCGIIPIRLSKTLDKEEKCILLINRSITSEYDLIANIKTFFQDHLQISLNVSRDAERYSRDYYDLISTIDFNKHEEKIITEKAAYLDYDNVSEVKNFMCKPLVVNGKVIGGYARMCPLCGSKVQTELTGMRLFKFKNDHGIYMLMSCPNCYENLRYASDLTIDQDDYAEGYLSLSAFVNGEEWIVKRKKIKLGHKAILNYLKTKK